MLTEKQKEMRRKGIGGSDVASVFNLPPYGCSRMLWYDKRSYKPDFDDTNPNMERGIYLEDIVCEIYEKNTGNKVVKRRAMASSNHPHMLANIDREIIPAIDHIEGVPMDKPTGVLEVKCPNRDNYLKMKRLGIVEAYILQGQHYMYVAGKQWMEYAIFCADMWQLEVIPIERDDTLVQLIIEAEEKFWKIVENGPTPDRLEQGDSRCKRCNWRLICWGEMWEDTGDDEFYDKDYQDFEDPEFVEVASVHKENVSLFKEAKENVDTSKKKLIDIIGDKEKVKCNSGKFCFKWEKKTVLDTKKLKKEEPDTVAKYQYETGSRPFRFYPSKDKG